MSERFKDAVNVAAILRIRPTRLLLIHDGHKKIGRDKQHGSAEVRRRDADYSERMLVDLNHAAEHAGIVLKPAMPISVGQNHIGQAVAAVLVGGVKDTP